MSKGLTLLKLSDDGSGKPFSETDQIPVIILCSQRSTSFQQTGSVAQTFLEDPLYVRSTLSALNKKINIILDLETLMD